MNKHTMLRSVLFHDLDQEGVEPPYHVLRLEQVGTWLWVEVVSYDENNDTTLLQVKHRFRFDADMFKQVLSVIAEDVERDDPNEGATPPPTNRTSDESARSEIQSG